MPHLIFLQEAYRAETHAERLRAHATPALAHTRLPASTAVRTEIAAMLEAAVPEPPVRRRRLGLSQRIRLWIPRLGLWLRAMPLP